MMDNLIDQREQTHGDYATTARFAREFKSVVEREAVSKLTAVQRESLDLICTKIARILSGKANDADHWRDIAGYAQLVLRELCPVTASDALHDARTENFYEKLETVDAWNFSNSMRGEEVSDLASE